MSSCSTCDRKHWHRVDCPHFESNFWLSLGLTSVIFVLSLALTAADVVTLTSQDL